MAADRSVRVAWVADAPAMGRVQVAAWRASYAGVVPAETIDAMAADEVAQTWAESIRRPPLATYRALVALERNAVVGLAAVGPSGDPDAEAGRDAELSVLVVDPPARGQGHGSRLLAAAVDTARADGFTRLTTWVLADDDAVRAFLVSAGWEPDGAHREVMLSEDADATARGTTARQVRLHTSLEET